MISPHHFHPTKSLGFSTRMKMSAYSSLKLFRVSQFGKLKIILPLVLICFTCFGDDSSL